MRSTFNLLTAYMALLLLIALSVIFVLRVINKKNDHKRLSRINRFLRRIHTPLCYAFYAFGLIHGLLSSEALFSFNLGSICFFASLLLWLHHLLRYKMKLRYLFVHRLLCVLCLCLTLWHILDCTPLLLPRVVKSWFVTMPEEHYRDGVYKAEATGYNRHLWVQVTVDGGRIAEVEIIEHYEKGKEYFERPMEVIPKEIIELQRTDVDVVAGATKTSLGIMEATRIALEQAMDKAP